MQVIEKVKVVPEGYKFDDVDFGEDKLWKYFNELK